MCFTCPNKDEEDFSKYCNLGEAFHLQYHAIEQNKICFNNVVTQYGNQLYTQEKMES